MNRQEWLNSPNMHNEYYKKVQKLLKEWKAENNITERCVAHHRDDTEECRKYNAEHYERWGCEEDGTFIDGKYIIFMTCAEHTLYHHAGKHVSDETKKKISENNIRYWKGKHLSDETKKKMSENNVRYWKGKHHTDETKKKISETNKVINDLWKIYKQLNGTMNYNEFRKSLKNQQTT